MSVYLSARFQKAPWKKTFISACVFALDPTSFRPNKSTTREARSAIREVRSATGSKLGHNTASSEFTKLLLFGRLSAKDRVGIPATAGGVQENVEKSMVTLDSWMPAKLSLLSCDNLRRRECFNSMAYITRSDCTMQRV